MVFTQNKDPASQEHTDDDDGKDSTERMRKLHGFLILHLVMDAPFPSFKKEKERKKNFGGIVVESAL